MKECCGDTELGKTNRLFFPKKAPIQYDNNNNNDYGIPPIVMNAITKALFIG